MKNKEHLTIEGINTIKKIRSKMNKSRPFEDKFNYCKSSLGMTTRPGGEIEIKYNLPCH
jgi:hypothetical protein